MGACHHWAIHPSKDRPGHQCPARSGVTGDRGRHGASPAQASCSWLNLRESGKPKRGGQNQSAGEGVCPGGLAPKIPGGWGPEPTLHSVWFRTRLRQPHWPRTSLPQPLTSQFAKSPFTEKSICRTTDSSKTLASLNLLVLVGWVTFLSLNGIGSNVRFVSVPAPCG